MTKDEIISFAESVTQLDRAACGRIVQSMMVNRTLSKAVRALDKLSRDEKHGGLAQTTLSKLGFDPH